MSEALMEIFAGIGLLLICGGLGAMLGRMIALWANAWERREDGDR